MEVRVFEFNPGYEPALEQMDKFTVCRTFAPAATRYKDMQAIPLACPAENALSSLANHG